MTSLPAEAREALAQFADCQGWEARARLLMQWGERLAPLAPQERCDTNRVEGCESRVWLVAQHQGGHWQLRADSDARLLRGLLALLLVRIQGLDGKTLETLDLAEWFQQLGLARQLSPSRSNGLHAVLQRIHGIITNPQA
ncbi:SufE family protein [Stutzerimonas kirkiae]|uniref:Fe-S metabolism protein SufE n=1 Tax=Stutzerimonas kirkiae TaxID=2211392 RepID=A0A4V2KDK9_9GAMM|nr:SufE family protein [Stutzerimonas kirkiae]TBV00110.1 Fe-S metabolism protein SufE [Stutzerimonas kirkiae]TBV03453.1 Fe-S metabolism protein SufE [Stutzerimonas kirkiae]TBV05816.1 Fe-S metabolism protein SufE [Stutzerimonas kirkiae]TBV17308.1 Fe-S metabolism protein SufE [Stutzerimonas kirkiae]